MAVQFVPFKTFVDSLFWDELTKRKLNDWKLDESPRPVAATYSNRQLLRSVCAAKDPQKSTTRLSFSYDAFLETKEEVTGTIHMDGFVLLLNTYEAFKNLNRKLLLGNAARRVKECIESLEWLQRPSSLNTFILTVYADLKKYTYLHWNCVPALLYPSKMKLLSEPKQLSTELRTLVPEFVRLYHNEPFLLVDRVTNPLSLLLSAEFEWTENTYVVYADPSTHQSYPGWPIRNLLAAIAYARKDKRDAKFICHRSGTVPSIVVHIGWEPDDILSTTAVGWERVDGCPSPSFTDLGSSFNPLKRMEQSAELNLRLIRWRLVPDINLQRITELKCLILGAGTLGCNVARSLLGWGVKHFTFVDNACISYSNVVRQSLFIFEDTEDSGKSKAVTAAEALRKIHPLVKTDGFCMKIPMPGHTVSKKEEAEVAKAVETLEDLVKQHDVTFLLLDSREARWLPTLLTTLHRKLAISVALGFDSFVVIRHGVSNNDEMIDDQEKLDSDPKLIPGSKLGCYFCSDVTAPGNSTVDRTMDQQCTVSRAGISSAASGAAVELLAAVVQHPQMGHSPACLGENDESTTVLGATPHQIRSFFSRFTQMTPAVRRFERCVACGTAVQSAYTKDGFQFLLEVFNDPKHLELVSGLDQLQASATQVDLWEFDDNESVSSI